MSNIQYITLPFLKVGFYLKNEFTNMGSTRSSAPLHNLTDFSISCSVVDNNPTKEGEKKAPMVREISLTFSDFVKAPHYGDYREDTLVSMLTAGLESFLMSEYLDLPLEEFRNITPIARVQHSQARAILEMAKISSVQSPLRFEYTLKGEPMMEVGLGHGIKIMIVPSDQKVKVVESAGDPISKLLSSLGDGEPTISGRMEIFGYHDYRFHIWRVHNNKSFVEEVSYRHLETAFQKVLDAHFHLFEALGGCKSMVFDETVTVVK